MNILSAKKISYYKDGLNILKDISFEVEKGDCISVVGASGSGKSTLLKICADLLSETSGDSYFKGEKYTSYNPIELRRQISYCIQIPQLFGATVRENLEFPFNIRKDKVDEDKIESMLKRFGLDNSYLEKSVNSLSGGEKQRISIIRNLLYIPEVLLLDEATSALDLENANIVEEYINELNEEGVTVLWVTHSLEQSTKIFNKRITLSQGEIEKVEVIR